MPAHGEAPRPRCGAWFGTNFTVPFLRMPDVVFERESVMCVEVGRQKSVFESPAREEGQEPDTQTPHTQSSTPQRPVPGLFILVLPKHPPTQSHVTSDSSTPRTQGPQPRPSPLQSPPPWPAVQRAACSSRSALPCCQRLTKGGLRSSPAWACAAPHTHADGHQRQRQAAAQEDRREQRRPCGRLQGKLAGGRGPAGQTPLWCMVSLAVIIMIMHGGHFGAWSPEPGTGGGVARGAAPTRRTTARAVQGAVRAAPHMLMGCAYRPSRHGGVLPGPVGRRHASLILLPHPPSSSRRAAFGERRSLTPAILPRPCRRSCASRPPLRCSFRTTPCESNWPLAQQQQQQRPAGCACGLAPVGPAVVSPHRASCAWQPGALCAALFRISSPKLACSDPRPHDNDLLSALPSTCCQGAQLRRR